MSSTIFTGSGSTAVNTQLGMKGPQDEFTVLGAIDTFFKGSIKKHSNFAIAEVFQIPTVSGFGLQNLFKLDRAGDAIGKMAYCGVLDPLTLKTVANVAAADVTMGNPGNGVIDGPGQLNNRWCSWVGQVGYHMFDQIELNIGNYPFYQSRGEFLAAEEDLYGSTDKPMDALIGGSTSMSQAFYQSLHYQYLQVNIPMWFTEHVSKCLPQIALTRHDIQLKLQMKTAANCIVQCNGYRTDGSDNLLDWTSAGATAYYSNTPTINNVALLVQYYYFDQYERGVMANAEHEFLIQQVQQNGDTTVSLQTAAHSVPIRLIFNHPVSRLLWWFISTEAANAHTWGDWSGGLYKVVPQGAAGTGAGTQLFADHSFFSAQLTFNSQARTPVQIAQFYRDFLASIYSKRIPGSFVYQYGFGIDHNSTDDCGSANMSRLDNVYLNLFRQGITTTNAAVNTSVAGTFVVDNTAHPLYANTQMAAGTFKVMAKNWNVMKIAGGMAGIYFTS